MLDHDYGSPNDHAQFREYGEVAGRWLSPDPYGGSYDATNPQSFNRYAYALNNPLAFLDPFGLDPCGDGNGGEKADARLAGAGGITASENGGGGSCIVGPSGGGGGGGGTPDPCGADPNCVTVYPTDPCAGIPNCVSGGPGSSGPTPPGVSGGNNPTRGLPPSNMKHQPSKFAKAIHSFCKNSPEQRVGAAVFDGAVQGVIVGGLGGAFLGSGFLGVGGIPGAILGGFVGGVAGAAGGVIKGGAYAAACSVYGVY